MICKVAEMVEDALKYNKVERVLEIGEEEDLFSPEYFEKLSDVKSNVADWLNNQNIRNQLNYEIKICLVKNGCPPQYSPEIFRQVGTGEMSKYKHRINSERCQCR